MSRPESRAQGSRCAADGIDLLRCPHCLASLSPGETSTRCEGCGREYAVLCGIADLRVPLHDAWIDFDADRALATALATDYSSQTFATLVRRVWEGRDGVPPHIVEKRIREISLAQSRYEEDLASTVGLGGALAGGPSQRCVEIGCGTGGFLAAAAKRFPVAVGVDISLTWLIAAKKRLEEQGRACLLVCACAERLPFAGEAFDVACAFDVLEHVDDAAVVVGEISRILHEPGRAICTIPNRFRLSAEPHVGLWGVGFLPRRWMPAYVRWRNGMNYHHTRPMSLLEVRSLFRSIADLDSAIETPELREENVADFSGAKLLFARSYNRARRFRVLRRTMLPVAPFFEIVARKRGGGGDRRARD
jgi:SAM-dependent methyltransferase